MSKKRLAVLILTLIAIVLSNYLVVTKMQPDGNMQPKLVMDVKSEKEELYQIYYSEPGFESKAWSEVNSSSAQYSAMGKTKTVELAFPQNTNAIRLDLGAVAAEHEISNVRFECKSESLDIDLKDVIVEGQENMVTSVEHKDGVTYVETDGTDAYLVLDVSEYDFVEFAMGAQETPLRINKIILCVVIDVLLLGAFLFLNKFSALPLEVYRSRRLVFDLAKNDFKTKYAGSYLGIIWAFVQPIVTIAVYSFVFQVGFRSGAVMECPFVLWLMAGMVPWFFFADALNGGTASMLEYSYLVKKVVFKISVLPIVKIISALFVHIFFVFITIVLFAIFGYYPDFYTIQVIYYSACLFIFVLAITYATCAIIIFFRDLGQIINIFLSVGVWMTPIMWQETMLPESLRWIVKINPLYYIVSGYRDALIDKVWFFEHPNQLVYFWSVTAVVFVLGSIIFKRLKVHFADVL